MPADFAKSPTAGKPGQAERNPKPLPDLAGTSEVDARYITGIRQGNASLCQGQRNFLMATNPRFLRPVLLQPSGRLAHSSRKRTFRPRDPVRYQRRYTAGPRQVHDRLSLIQSLREGHRGPPCDMTPPLAWRPTPARRVARHDTVPVFRPAADDAHPVTASVAASTGRREPIRQPARPKIRTRPARRPSRAERRRTGPPGWQGIPQSGAHSGCPFNVTKRAQIGKASGSTDRSFGPDAVRLPASPR